MLYDLPSIPHATGHVQDGLVADDVGQADDLPEELRLHAVDVFPLPEAGSDHRCTDIYQDASGQHAGEGLFEFQVNLAELPLQMAHVALDTGHALLSLCLLVDVDWHSKVLDTCGTWDAGDIRDFILRKHL